MNSIINTQQDLAVTAATVLQTPPPNAPAPDTEANVGSPLPAFLQQADHLFNLIWKIERQLQHKGSQFHSIGHDGWPDRELIRFRSNPQAGFAGRDIEQIDHAPSQDGIWRHTLTVNTPALTGIRGVLPDFYNDLVLNQQRNKAPQLRDFLDIFNHRLLSLKYRSWAKTQPALQQELSDQDIFTQIMRSLTGIQHTPQLYYAGLASRVTCSANNLEAALQQLTGIKTRITSLTGRWQSLAHADQSHLPSRKHISGMNAHLGEAILGRRCWMPDTGVRITFIPQTGTEILQIMPGGSHSQAITDMVKAMVGSRLQISYQVTAQQSLLSGCQLGSSQRLGHDSFLGGHSSQQLITTSFKPGNGQGINACHP